MTELDSPEKEGLRDHSFWPKDTGRGLVAWIFAAIFVLLIAAVPVILHYCGSGEMTRTSMIEAGLLLVWLIGGLYLFTQVLLFQSPHFGGKVRSLTLVEAVYLFSQIITTVGYGDITPAKPRGQVFVGIFVFFSIILIAGMVMTLIENIMERASREVKELAKRASFTGGVDELGEVHKYSGQTPRLKADTSPGPLIGAFSVFGFSVLAGAVFFVTYPGENKTVFQAVYMSLITLSTVGFGAFTPVTEIGMVFGAFWMLFGVASLGAVIAAFTEWMMARKKFEQYMHHKEKHEEAVKQKKRESMASADQHLSSVATKGSVDKLGYLRYCLIQEELLSKPEIDEILADFRALDKGNKGVVAPAIVREQQI